MNHKQYFDAREPLRKAFLSAQGCDPDQPLSIIGEDMASRRYFRLDRNGQSVLLMEAVPDGDPMATLGHSISDYIRISQYLRSIGLRTPQVLAEDANKNGYLLIEDFGDTSFKKALEQGRASQEELYELATDVLILLRQKAHPGDIPLPGYYASHVHAGRRRVVDWTLPVMLGRDNPDGWVESYLAAWDDVERQLPPVPVGFLHIDYHLENLMWIDGATGLDRCGVLDFQGAMNGPLPYDLANLLEDPRPASIVPPHIRTAMFNRYAQSMTKDERDAFAPWYRVMASQFHCRVIGQFIKLATLGKPRYLDMVPRVAEYLTEGLKDPVLAPVAQWFADRQIDFTALPDLQSGQDQAIAGWAQRKLFRPDAF